MRLVPVAQKLDSSFVIGFANTYPGDVAIQHLKNWVLVFSDNKTNLF